MRQSLTAINLEHMADISQDRRKKFRMAFSSVAVVFLLGYGIVNWFLERELFALTNFAGAAMCAVYFAYLYIKPYKEHHPALFNIAMLLNATVNLVFPDGTVFWVFPILAGIIIVNDFKPALITTLVFVLSASLYLYLNNFSWVSFTYSRLPADRFILSLSVMCFIGLISNYYYAKATDYLQGLYQEGIDQLAYRDRLTGLANRWSFETWAKQKLQEQKGNDTITALLFLDIDNFKTINDTYGHDTGDKLLQHFANRLSRNLRTTDRKTNEQDYSVARYAGDEFMLLLYDIPRMDDLRAIVNRVNKLFEDDLKQENYDSNLTFSIGVAIYKQDAEELEDLIRCADKAMYEAKKSGKNRYRFYQSSQNMAVTEKVAQFNLVRPQNEWPENNNKAANCSET